MGKASPRKTKEGSPAAPESSQKDPFTPIIESAPTLTTSAFDQLIHLLKSWDMTKRTAKFNQRIQGLLQLTEEHLQDGFIASQAEGAPRPQASGTHEPPKAVEPPVSKEHDTTLGRLVSAVEEMRKTIVGRKVEGLQTGACQTPHPAETSTPSPPSTTIPPPRPRPQMGLPELQLTIKLPGLSRDKALTPSIQDTCRTQAGCRICHPQGEHPGTR